MDKAARLLELARKRQESRWPGYRPLVDYHGGAYECDFVSPYTKSAGNVDAEVMVMLQDWSSDERLSGPLDRNAAELGHTPSLPTNRNLAALLRQHLHVGMEQAYCTNLFPFIKVGKLSASISAKDFSRAAREFALPQIEIVEPRLVVCLGLKTFNGLRSVMREPPLKTMAVAIDEPFSYGTTRIWCQSHTGQLGRNGRNRGGVDRVSQDWARMREDMERAPVS
jgi:uracil-DNA glycosylase